MTFGSDTIRIGTTKRKRILIDGDIKGCFDNISHDTLMELLEPYSISIMKEQIWMSLKSGAIDKGIKISTASGTPQGGLCRTRHNKASFKGI